MSDPGSISSRWLSGRRLAVAELDVNADSLAVFAGSVDAQATPAEMYSAMTAVTGGVVVYNGNPVVHSGDQVIYTP